MAYQDIRDLDVLMDYASLVQVRYRW